MLLPRHFPAFIVLACVGAVAVALVTQYGFGLRPCILCLYQRVPYVVAGLLAAGALLPMLAQSRRSVLIGLAAVAFGSNGGIAVFHVGVERHWWAGPATCADSGAAANSIEALQGMLAGPPPVPCDQVPWELLGISMAGYNALLSFFLAVVAGWWAIRCWFNSNAGFRGYR